MKILHSPNWITRYQVEIIIPVIERRIRIVKLRKYCDDNIFHWWVYHLAYSNTKNEIITLWHFREQGDAMQFELAWG